MPIETEKVPIEAGKMPIETERVPIGNLSTQLRIIFQFVKENRRFIEYNKISRRADLCVR